jgi:hypothetical protein
MPAHWSTACAAIGVLVGALACAGNSAKTDEETAAAGAAADTTRDTTGQNPSGYRGMERDTSMVPPAQPNPSDTFLQKQGTGEPQDTSGYSGIERVDTTGGMQPDTTMGGMQHDTTTGGMQPDTSGMQHDTTSGDTTGYERAQQQDSTSR